MERITLRLPVETLQVVRRLARGRDITPGHLMREAIGAEIRRCTRNAKTPNRADEQLLGPLRVLLASDFARATSWHDLNERLRAKGYALREAGGGLALHEAPGGARLCKASELGHAYGALMRRFGAPFPGHAHRHLADRILGPARPPDAPPDDFDVIEPF